MKAPGIAFATWVSSLLWAMLPGPGVAAAGDVDTNNPVMLFDTLRDPTVLSSRVSAGYEYSNQREGAFRNKFTLAGAYTFGVDNRRDWIVSAELPFIDDELGDNDGREELGVGDFKLGVGHILDGNGRFRWGLGLGGTFDTASEERFGDGVFKLSPIWGGGFRFTPDFELIGNVQYSASVVESSGRIPVTSVEIKPALLKFWPRRWYSLLGWDSSWDFENRDLHRGKARAEVGKALGGRQQWVLYTGVDVPVIHAGRDNFTFKTGVSYVF